MVTYTQEPRVPPCEEATNGARFSFAGLIRDLVDDTRTLFRQEMRLARAEMSEKASKAARDSVSVVVGGAVAFAGALALLAAACTGLWSILVTAGLNHGKAVWIAPLIIGALAAIIGYAMIHAALAALRNTSVVPTKTTQSLKETGRWMQEKVS